jgi:hypothetical protein
MENEKNAFNFGFTLIALAEKDGLFFAFGISNKKCGRI